MSEIEKNSINTNAAKGITFEVDKVEKAKVLLKCGNCQDIITDILQRRYRNITLSEKIRVKPDKSQILDSIVTHNTDHNLLVNFGDHPFAHGILCAYGRHFPITLSPDVIWEVICLGFAQHVNNNAERLRNMFVDFDGQKTLEITVAQDYTDKTLKWSSLFDIFNLQIGCFVGKDLIDTLTANFSTTTPVTKTATQITVMGAFKHYFKYEVVSLCGFPEITLSGTVDDWKMVLEKTRKLAKYELEWWIDCLIPILQEFVNAAEGNINLPFWQEMCNAFHSDGSGATTYICGWLAYFFPYSQVNDYKYANREQFHQWRSGEKRIELDILTLPNECVAADLLWTNLITGKITDLEINAGIVGLEQNSETFALKPVIGWWVNEKLKSVE